MTELNALTVQTTNFGEVEVPAEKIIHFKEGIPGFPAIRKFAILELETLKPFQYLQSLDEPPIALLVVNPFLLHPAYKFDLADADMEELHTGQTDDVTVYAVATIPENPYEATLNLMAPILINQKDRRGKQVILLEGQFSMRHPLFGSSECQNSGGV
jgi:flagellar assembly factor FliW